MPQSTTTNASADESAKTGLAPGEWEIRIFHGRTFICERVGDDNGAIQIAEVTALKFRTAKNAALLASAPQLLAALDYLSANPNDYRAHGMALAAMKVARGEACPRSLALVPVDALAASEVARTKAELQRDELRAKLAEIIDTPTIHSAQIAEARELIAKTGGAGK